jgi:hypothetical protein
VNFLDNSSTPKLNQDGALDIERLFPPEEADQPIQGGVCQCDNFQFGDRQPLDCPSGTLKGEPCCLNEYNRLGKGVAFAAICYIIPSYCLVEVLQFSANSILVLLRLHVYRSIDAIDVRFQYLIQIKRELFAVVEKDNASHLEEMSFNPAPTMR